MRLKKKKGVWFDGKHVPKIGNVPTSAEEVNPANQSRPIPREVSIGFGRTYPVSGGVWLHDTANTIFAGNLGPDNQWCALHYPTCNLLIYSAPTLDYIKRVFEEIRPRLDLYKLLFDCWNDRHDILPDDVRDYLGNVWKVQYPLSSLPTFKQWQKSNCGNSARSVNQCRGIMPPPEKAKRRKR